ncbi:hypothetical protein CYLTODRAFT_356614 [Cylindrobasidium torrendii FP15055 ss-10]|uniref:RING-type domain-containing protein n=1 Tax=Cylindrobasidium torrendii FP15055 ss-10 TaxID=1314674 RepID=A0A0D7B5N8_9AGAR|nr:hypothetical protein CYLTODRAFT_356614 [Cylindrobasidium torrendii FP15055 ss-10]
MAGVENRLLCNCCFDEYPLAQMAQCTEAHLICVGCFTRHVEMHLGMDNTTRIICISSVSVRCEAPYHESEVRRLLPESVGLYERIRQREDIERSGLGMLEECPRCSYASIVKNDASLIRCKNRACRLVSCRECKKVDHSPRSCAAEAEREHRNGRHAVEEAMTAALVRKCPNCRRPFTKESGCNKMKCPNCWTVSCYVCRQVLTGADPYTHFTVCFFHYHVLLLA